MKAKLFTLAAITTLSCVLFLSCSSNQSSSEEDYETTDEEVNALAGKFSHGSDTLTIEKEVSAYSNEIEFMIFAMNTELQQNLFNSAPYSAGDDNSESYAFKDSSEYTYEDIIFTYSYEKDQWTLVDNIYENDPDSTKKLNLAGVYSRIE